MGVVFSKVPTGSQGNIGVIAQTHPAINRHISIFRHFIKPFQVGLVGMETIHVLHPKLSGPHYPSLRPRLIAELGLDLINRPGKIFIREVKFLYQRGHDFFMGRTDDIFRVMFVFGRLISRYRFHQNIDLFESARLLPIFHRFQSRHQYLVADLIHLFPDDVFDFCQNT